jgi:UDP-N-acetyl-D-glucosamine dehydrogenase
MKVLEFEDELREVLMDLKALSFAQLCEVAGVGGESAVERPLVCVQGLGFVGAAMAIAVANAHGPDGSPFYNVVGVELPTDSGIAKVSAINRGRLPMTSSDGQLQRAFDAAYAAKNLIATTDVIAYRAAQIAIVDVHLDVEKGDSETDEPSVDFAAFRAAIRALGEQLPAGALVIVETTVPPGTCQHVVAPELEQALRKRGLPADAVMVAHAYERVMPGEHYYDSIVNYWRVFAGLTPAAADACEAFLTRVVNTEQFPLARLQSTTASEMAKVLENSYRAANIAFIEEWGRFSEQVGVDLFDVIDAVRVRPTHQNIRQPGFGVGGYCLTKDPLLARVAARQIFERPELDFPFCRRAVAVNDRMPLVSLAAVRAQLGGSLQGKRLLLLGVSYRQDVGDTRFSPAARFVDGARSQGADIICHDPMVSYWPELDWALPAELPAAVGFDAIVFAVAHRQYRQLSLSRWLGAARPLIFDANRVLKNEQRCELDQIGCPFASIGRGSSSRHGAEP